MDELLDEFKQVYKEKGAHNFQSQTKYLSALADHYHRLGTDNSDWVCLLKAHTLYNSVATRDKEGGTKWSAKAFEAQETYWQNKAQISLEKQQENTECVRKELAELRKTTQTKLDNIKDKFTKFEWCLDPERLNAEKNEEMSINFVDHMEHVSAYCSDGIVAVFNMVVEKAVKILGILPPSFCTVALGSLARGEATPYSDFEFLFLLKNKSPEAVKYLEDLAMAVYFLIGDLQETKLKYMAIEELSGWFEDVSTNGLKIDGLQKWAGNIPTGNGSAEQHNHFICTVEDLVSRYKNVYNNPDPVESLRGDLTAMLSSTVFVYGDESLLRQFVSEIQQLEHTQVRQNASRNMLQNDVEKYDFFPDASLNRKRNLKSDIYRYPSMLMLDLRILHDLKCSSKETINELVSKNVLSPSVAKYLRHTLACALYIRLSAYLYHGSQNENISVLSANPDHIATKDQWYVDRPLLLYMMLHLMELKTVAHQRSLNKEVEMTSNKRKLSVAVVSYYCNDHQLCYDVLKDLNAQGYITSIHSKIMYSECARLLGLFDEAISILTETLSVLQCRPSEVSSSLISTCYNNLGVLYRQKNNKAKAISYFEKALEGVNIDPLVLAACHNNLGTAWQLSGSFSLAQICHNKSLQIRQNQTGNLDYPGIAACLNNLGNVHCHCRKLEKAENYFTKALTIRQALYGNADHPDIAASYHNLGVAKRIQKLHDEAAHFFKKSTEMRQRMYSGSDFGVYAPGILHSRANIPRVGNPLSIMRNSEEETAIVFGRRYDT